MNPLYPHAFYVQFDEDWELLRLLRNATADGMTRHQKEISRVEQQYYRNTTKKRHWIFKVQDVTLARSITVGWCSLDDKGSYDEFSYGVSPFARGNGYGKHIIEYLKSGHRPLRGEVWAWNDASRHIMKKAGFVEGEKFHNQFPLGVIIPVEWKPE